MATAKTRATDDDRNTTCQILDAALGDGQLSMEEHRERVSSATKALTLGELQSLVSDLQIRATPSQSRTVTPTARSRGVWIAVAAHRHDETCAAGSPQPRRPDRLLRPDGKALR